MSISTELTNYSTYLTNAYNKCNDKGATMPQNKNLQNLTSCIDSISGGGSNPFEANFPNVQYGLLYALTSQPQINFPSTNTNCNGLFQYCFAIPSLNVSGYNTTNVTNMQNMFLSCKSVTSITFGGSFSTARVTNMQGMFQYCQNLASLDLSTFNTANVTNMSNMFNLYNSTSGNSSFTKLTSITFGNNFNTEKVTSMQGMFQVCDLLPSVDLSKFSAGKCSNMSYMFTSCNKMTSIDVHYLATNVNTTMREMFSLCTRVQTINFGTFNCSKVTNMSNAFNRCDALVTITGSLSNIGQAYTSSTQNYSQYTINLSASTSLTRDSLMNIINGLYDLATARKSKAKLNDWSNKSCKAFKHRNRSCNK